MCKQCSPLPMSRGVLQPGKPPHVSADTPKAKAVDAFTHTLPYCRARSMAFFGGVRVDQAREGAVTNRQTMEALSRDSKSNNSNNLVFLCDL